MENQRMLGAQRRWWAERKDGRQRHAERRSRLSRSFPSSGKSTRDYRSAETGRRVGWTRIPR